MLCNGACDGAVTRYNSGLVQYSSVASVLRYKSVLVLYNTIVFLGTLVAK